jgi:excisionase family DNA binding protein
MSDLSVAEAAQRLQVSPRRVRALLEDGRLQGRQVAGRWLLPSRAVDHRQRAAPASGRPLSPASAWHALAILAKADDAISHLPAPVRSRARGRAEALRNMPPSGEEVARRWQSALARRAEICEYYAHPSVLERLLDDPAVVRSGISAVGDHGAGLMVLSGAEGYVLSRDLPHLESLYALNPNIDAAQANVRVHLVADDRAAEWLFLHRVAPAAVVAADLVERDSSRDRAAGVKLACRL